jgi:hypothetical protein
MSSKLIVLPAYAIVDPIGVSPQFGKSHQRGRPMYILTEQQAAALLLIRQVSQPNSTTNVPWDWELTHCSPCTRASVYRRCRYVPCQASQARCPVKTFPDSGAQPLVNEDGSLALAVNGEIYNHRILRRGLRHQYDFKTHSDCEVVIPLVCAKGLL